MNTRNKTMRMTTFVTLAIFVLIASAQAQTAAGKPTDTSLRNRSEFRLDLFRVPARRQSLLLRPGSFSLMPDRSGGTNASAMTAAFAANLPVVGSGTVGKLTRWTGITGSNSVIGDSNIFEDKFGKIGIGTTTPSSLLTVQGMIEITLGGLKFPDGTVQTTSAAGALFSVAHDATLQGPGTSSSPLGVAIPLILSGSNPNSVLFAAQNNADGGDGVGGFGGSSLSGNGGVGMSAVGGTGTGAGRSGGTGITARGGIGADGAGNGIAARFEGDVDVNGNLSKASGSFKIDHPLDPQNKYLYHSFVESPDMKNIYDGVIRLDANGDAIIAMPEWFSALNRDFRYLLTPIGAPMPGLYIAEELL